MTAPTVPMPQALPMLQRTMQLAVDQEAMATRAEGDERIPISLSSEQPVERWFGREILDHSAAAVDLTYARAGLPFLMDHDTGTQIGLLEAGGVGHHITQIGTTQIGTLEIGGVEHSTTQIGTLQVEACQIRLEKLLLLQVAAVHIGLQILQGALAAQLGSCDRRHRGHRKQQARQGEHQAKDESRGPGSELEEGHGTPLRCSHKVWQA